MSKPSFTVIIPIYNSEKYLHRAVESVLSQTYDNVSLILVDDGSVDNSGTICDDYARKYNNINVIHKENGGTSSAKNRGLDLAQSEYIALMDSDDYIDKDLFESVANIIDLYAPDCIDFGYRYVSRNGEKTENFHQLTKNILFDKQFICETILPPLLNLERSKENFIFDFAVNKIYKKEILDKYNIRFEEERISWEDRPYVIDYVNQCNTYFCMDKCFYNYVDIPNSLSRRFTNIYFDAVLKNYIDYKTKFGR